MTTKREGILAQIASSLNSISGADLFRSRLSAFLKSESPAIHLTWASDVPEQITSPFLDWTLTVKVSAMVRADVPDSSADSLVADIHDAVMTDAVLNNLCIAINPGPVDLKLIQADSDAAVVTMDFLIQYRTELDDLEG